VYYLCVVGVGRAEGLGAHVEGLLVERFGALVVGLARIQRSQISIALGQLLFRRRKKTSS
jgi:hypothetical protein